MRVFLDATCWIAAAGSPTGGSACILNLARAGYFMLATTRLILQEAERNIGAKMGRDTLLRYYRLLGSLPLELVPDPSEEEIAYWQEVIDPKDCHVLAGAVKARADILVSLDRKHILTEKVRNHFPIPVQDTKSFLRDLMKSFE